MKVTVYNNTYHLTIVVFMVGLVYYLYNNSEIFILWVSCVPSVLFYIYVNFFNKKRPPQKKTNNENFNKLVDWENYSGIEWREKIIRRRKYIWFIRIKQKLHLKYLILKDRIRLR